MPRGPRPPTRCSTTRRSSWCAGRPGPRSTLARNSAGRLPAPLSRRLRRRRLRCHPLRGSQAGRSVRGAAHVAVACPCAVPPVGFSTLAGCCAPAFVWRTHIRPTGLARLFSALQFNNEDLERRNFAQVAPPPGARCWHQLAPLLACMAGCKAALPSPRAACQQKSCLVAMSCPHPCASASGQPNCGIRALQAIDAYQVEDYRLSASMNVSWRRLLRPVTVASCCLRGQEGRRPCAMLTVARR